MNQADKAEALRLIQEADEFCPLALSVSLTELRALIERQPDDTDGEMWRFCVEHGFPTFHTTGWEQNLVHGNVIVRISAPTPAETTRAAMAAMKEKA